MKPPKFTGIAASSDDYQYLAITEDGRIYEISPVGTAAGNWEDGWAWKLVSSYAEECVEAEQ